MSDKPEDPLQKVMNKYADRFMGRFDRMVNVEVKLYPEELPEFAAFLAEIHAQRPH